MTQPTQHVGDTVRTTCGRRITVGRLRLAGLAHPTTRVTLDMDRELFDEGEVWASLTPAEARRLAGHLLAQAAAAERASGEAAEAGAAQTGRLEVAHVTGDSYALAVRTHALLVDQPADMGGDDTAATPTELFVGSLASCVAFYAGRFLTRHGMDREGLRVTAEFAMATDRPTRVAEVRLAIAVPPGLPAERRAALLAVARHCTVHNSLTQPPRVEVDLA